MEECVRAIRIHVNEISQKLTIIEEHLKLIQSHRDVLSPQPTRIQQIRDSREISPEAVATIIPELILSRKKNASPLRSTPPPPPSPKGEGL
jgi:hypothetical protein